MTITTSIIIVTYNAAQLIDRCLAPFARDAQAPNAALEVIVVDNDSQDDTVEILATRYPWVTCITGHGNVGMAAGNNIGITHARGDYLAFINSDAFLEVGAIDTLVARLSDASDIGLVAPQLRNEDGSLQRSIRGFPTAWRYATEFWYVRKIQPSARWCNALYGAGYSHEQTCSVEWISGAVMIVPRTTVDAVGPIPDAYFMYGEELEWQWNMHKHGLQRVFEPAARAVHLGGASSAGEWNALYPMQVANHLRFIMRTGTPRAARRVRRVLESALIMRAFVYRCAALCSSGDRKRRFNNRVRAFVAAREAVQQLADISR